MKISENIYNIGVNDYKTDLFEGQYSVPNGMAYNSYVIIDEKIAVFDTVDARFGGEWLEKLKNLLGTRKPDYLVVLHMEPDHSANILNFSKEFPSAQIVGNAKTFVMIAEYFGCDFAERRVVVNENDTLRLGSHSLKFIFAPMVHWPEVMVAYEEEEKVLFSADAFGKFGALDASEDWDDEARRYYIGIVGKYGVQVQGLFKKLADTPLNVICPLHGPVLKEEIPHCLDLYNKWSRYLPEVDGIMIAYASVYGNTRFAAELLKSMLEGKGVKNVAIYDLARSDRALCVAEAFKYSKIVLAATTYNGDIFPAMREFLDWLTERNFQNRTVALIENGSWAPVASRTVLKRLEKCKNLTFAENSVTIRAALNDESRAKLAALADELAK